MRIAVAILLAGCVVGEVETESEDEDIDEDGAVPTERAGLADADNWNYPNDNFFRCVSLKASTAPLRYSDFAPIGPSYAVRNNLSYDEPFDVSRGFCKPGQIRLDAFELIESKNGRMFLHKGGQGYAQGKIPYGHIWISDLASSPSPLRPASESPEYGAPSAIGTSGARDAERRNGRGCWAMDGYAYRAKIHPPGTPGAVPETWQYKPEQSTSRYNKYADAGAEQGDGTSHYAYVLWSWLHKGDGETKSPGGGMVRTIMRDGQVFHRCAVKSINSIAYAPNSKKEVGRVTAIYGKTRASADAPWLYGWVIHSHRAKTSNGYGARTYHLQKF